jgi:hypothetical protein
MLPHPKAQRCLRTPKFHSKSGDICFSSRPAQARRQRTLGCNVGRRTWKKLAMSRRSIIPTCDKTGNGPILYRN